MTRTMFALLVVSGCASGFDPVRFKNAAPIAVVNDRVPVPVEPKSLDFVKKSEYFDSFVVDPVMRLTAVEPQRRATNTNSLDEVPDSTWFRNRIGVRDVSLDEIRDGARTGDSPMLHKPWTIKSTKVGGVSIGFIIEDTTGAKYVLKFDQKGLPETETAADVIGARLFWACGYHTPDDQIVTFKRSDLVIGKDAKVKPLFDKPYPLTEKILEDKLTRVNIGADGSIRGLASRFLVGKPLGAWPRTGVREDDPNDTIPHEQRRDLRGAFAMFSWLDHVDMKADQTVDMYVKDPGNPKQSYVMHYNIDFGKMLGVFSEAGNQIFAGHSYAIDLAQVTASLMSLGVYQRPWEHRTNPNIPGVGIFESRGYHPGNWKPVTPSYIPLLHTDRFDAFWGAKIIMRFTPDQIREAVKQGQFSDPRAVDYLTRVLIERQRKTGRYWFERVNPVDKLELVGEQLCFDDLAVAYDLDRRPVSYRASTFDFGGRALTAVSVQPDPARRGRVCATGVKASGSTDGYTIVQLETLRGKLPPTLVHLAKDASGTLRIIGLRRL
jgi:hypothetical protein